MREFTFLLSGPRNSHEHITLYVFDIPRLQILYGGDTSQQMTSSHKKKLTFKEEAELKLGSEIVKKKSWIQPEPTWYQPPKLLTFSPCPNSKCSRTGLTTATFPTNTSTSSASSPSPMTSLAFPLEVSVAGFFSFVKASADATSLTTLCFLGLRETHKLVPVTLHFVWRNRKAEIV